MRFQAFRRVWLAAGAIGGTCSMVGLNAHAFVQGSLTPPFRVGVAIPRVVSRDGCDLGGLRSGRERRHTEVAVVMHGGYLLGGRMKIQSAGLHGKIKFRTWLLIVGPPKQQVA